MQCVFFVSSLCCLLLSFYKYVLLQLSWGVKNKSKQIKDQFMYNKCYGSNYRIMYTYFRKLALVLFIISVGFGRFIVFA